VVVLALVSRAAAAAPTDHRKRGHHPSHTRVKHGQPDPAVPPAPAEPATQASVETQEPAVESPAAEAPSPSEDAHAPAAWQALRVSSAPPSLCTSTRANEPNSFEVEIGHREAARLAAGRSEIAIIVGLAVGRRDFTFSDPIGTPPQAYHLTAAPMATVGLEAYPLASTDIPVLRDLGMRGHFGRAIAVGSSTSAGASIDTTWTRFGGELRQRILVPGAHHLELGASGGVDVSFFDLRSTGNVGALVPTSRMVSLSLGGDARVVVVGRLSLLAGAAYLLPLSHGEIYDRFRDPHIAGVDGNVGTALRLATGLELRVDGRYTRYFARFSPQVGDPNVAGGALDQQFQLGMGIRYAH
jgi:hypothetical protein